MKNEYISLFSLEDIEKTTSRPRKKAMLLNRTKKTELKHMKLFPKNGQRILDTAFLKYLQLLLKNMKPKNLT